MRGLGNSFSVAFMGVGDHYAEIWYEILDRDNTQWFDCSRLKDKFSAAFWFDWLLQTFIEVNLKMLIVIYM